MERAHAFGGLARRVADFLHALYAKWQRDRIISEGAALAFYTLFSLAPLLMLVIAIAGLALGQAAVQGKIVGEIGASVGPETARMIEGMLVHVSSPRSGLIATVLSILTMLFGASAILGQLQASLNHIWAAAPARRGGIIGVVLAKLRSLGIIVGIGLLLFLSLTLSAILVAVHSRITAIVPALDASLEWLNFGLSFLLTTVLFGMIYKVLPAVDLRWRDVAAGASITALLFTIGKTLIAWYLGRASVASVYGAAGSLVLLLLWVYYSAQIILAGAVITAVWSGHRPESAAPAAVSPGQS